jgi:hypothetical protein
MSGQATAKPRQEISLFCLISIKFKHLDTMFAHLSGLRPRYDEPRAKWRHRILRLTTHAAAPGFFAAAGWQVQARGVDGCHEIEENIPQRSRAPVIFRSACA